MKVISLTHAIALSLTIPLAVTSAETLYWNPGGSSTSWDASLLNWSLAAGDPGDRSWAAGATTPDIAVFSGAGGTVTASTGLGAGGLRFEQNGYTLTGASPFQLNGLTPSVYVANGQLATMSGVDFRITTSDKRFDKTGGGTLRIESGKNFFGDSGAATTGAQVRVIEGKLEVAGAAFKNAQTVFMLSAGTELALTNDSISILGFWGQGSITGSNNIVVGGQGGSGANFSGTLNHSGHLTKANGAGTQVLSGAVSNTFSGTLTVTTGTLALAKTGGATAYGGSLILLGNSGSASATPTLRLDGETQFSLTPNLTFTANNQGTATFNLNGTSATLQNLTANLLHSTTPGKNRIDFGENTTAQTLTFNQLLIAASGTPLLEVINFDFERDTLRFQVDPTLHLPRMTINGADQLVAVESGGYWNVQLIPEPSSMVLVMATGSAWLLLKRKRTR